MKSEKKKLTREIMKIVPQSCFFSIILLLDQQKIGEGCKIFYFGNHLFFASL